MKTNKNIVLAAMIMAVAMTTIDSTIVAMAASTIEKDLNISHHALTWSVNAYILATAAFFMLGGKLADVYGHKKMVMIGIVGFAVFSILCGLTPEGGAAWMIIMRSLQGVSGALMFPAALGIVRNSFPAGEQGKAASTFFGISGAMTAIGPIVGGYLINISWRYIFFINVPIAIIALALLFYAKVDADGRNEKIDWQGAALSAAGMIALVIGFQQAGAWGWINWKTWVFILAGLALLAYFVKFEKTTSEPLVNMNYFKDKGFSLSTLATFFASFTFIAIFFFMSVYAQVSLGLSPGDTGVVMLKFFIGFVVASNIGGNWYDDGKYKLTLIIGGLLSTAGLIWWSTLLTNFSNGSGFFDSPQFWPTVMTGAGIGFMFSAASTDVADRAGSKAYGEATGISQTAKNLGGAIGMALLSTILMTSLSTRLEQKFESLGAPAGTGQAVAQSISSGEADESNNSTMPPEEKQKFTDAVKEEYAAAVKPVYYAMAVSMALVAIVGFVYPASGNKKEESEPKLPRQKQ